MARKALKPSVPVRGTVRHPPHKEEAANRQGVQISGSWAVITAITSQAVVITGVLYYFGWAHTQAAYNHLGVDPSLLGFTTTDYLLRSVNCAVPPLTIAALVGLALLWAHRRILAPSLGATPDSATRKRLAALTLAIRMCGVALGAIVPLGLLLQLEIGVPLGLALPSALVAAVSLLGYGGYLRALQTSRKIGSRQSHGSSPATRTGALLLLSLGILGAIWWIALYAEKTGEDTAAHWTSALSSEPEIVLYSSDRIALAGTGVFSDEITQEGSKYRYRYRGLRLVAHTNGKYIITPSEWQKGRDHVFLISDNDSLRADMVATPPVSTTA